MARGRMRFYDPAGERFGLPSWPWGLAPDGYATKGQLRAAGLRPGGQPVAGQLLWTSRRRSRTVRTRSAALYLIELARPVREMTPGRARALAAAMRARRTCPLCGLDAGYVIPTSLGACVPCAFPTTAADLAA